MNLERYLDCRFLIQERERLALPTELRGLTSELAVYDTLITLPSVSGVKLCEEKNPYFDMIVRINEKKYQVQEVRVQVKSSRAGRKKYWRSMGNRNGVKIEDRKNFLKKMRVIVLLGTRSISQIQGDFLKHLMDINDHV